MRHVAIVGSGPAGYYTAETLQKAEDITVDVIDRLPVPYGLIRTGVAPDHQSIKAVSRRYEGVALADNVRFVGHVSVGTDVGIDELTQLYDAVVLATGAPNDRPLGVPGADLPGVIGSAAFVGWYNGHPDFADLDPPLDSPGVAVIGNGNVALDVARILAKTPAEFAGSDIVAHARDLLATSNIRHIHILGRRGPHQIAMTPKELGELGHLERASPRVDPADLPDEGDDALLEPGMRKSVTHLRHFAANPVAKPVTIDFDFFAMPVAIEGDGRAQRVIVERTRLDADLRSHGTGETYAIEAGLVVSCIGYQTPPIPGSPMNMVAAASPMTRGGSCPASIASAGRGAGRRGRSAPTSPTARASPKWCWRISAAVAARRAVPASMRCSRGAASRPSPFATGARSRRRRSPPRSKATRARNSSASRR